MPALAPHPSTLAFWTPAWLAPWLIRLGDYLQAIGRERYHQCAPEKQTTIHTKLERVYGSHEA